MNMRTASRGFTLIELMVVVAIVAIFAAIAYPGYQNAIRKSRRSDAKSAVLDLAARQERYFSTHNAYATTPTLLGYAGAAFPVDVVVGDRAYYQVDMAVDNAAGTYTVSAIPKGAQAVDTCGTYTLNSTGRQGNSVSPATGCW